MGRQATDLDENFGTPLTEIPNIVVPRPISAFPRSKIQRFTYSPKFPPRLFFQAVPCARIAGAIFVRELPRGGF